jgi:hypothetical protein
LQDYWDWLWMPKMGNSLLVKVWKWSQIMGDNSWSQGFRKICTQLIDDRHAGITCVGHRWIADGRRMRFRNLEH